MSHPASIKIHLKYGDAKRLRTAEIMTSWTGIAIAAPRSDLDELVSRDELAKPGIYILLGNDIENGEPMAYIGEAETVASRLKQHKERDFWNSAIVVVSKDENLTKSHIRYLEGKLIKTATEVGRYKIDNAQSSGAKLPESDKSDMEFFLEKVSQLLPILGTDLLTPIISMEKVKNNQIRNIETTDSEVILQLEIKGIKASGSRSPNGFVVFKGSKAIISYRESAQDWVIRLKENLISNGTLINVGGSFEFVKDAEFSSPSAAAAVIVGGNANGQTLWRNQSGKSLKEIESLS